MVSPRVARVLTEAMIRHLPPSASRLRLLDLGGKTREVLEKHRPDVEITAVDSGEWGVPSGAFDAVTAFDDDLRPDLLAAALDALRAGGRLIIMNTRDDPSEEQVRTLEKSGYTRILVEIGAECPLPVGVLMRGEKPHTTDDTHARVRLASDADADAQTLDTYRGRFVYLLVRQTPNKPIWAIRADEPVIWRAVTLNGALLAFTSLPKAVAFMQPVVVQGKIRDVSKFARFSVATAKTWTQAVRLNPPIAALDRAVIDDVEVDPNSAEAPEE